MCEKTAVLRPLKEKSNETACLLFFMGTGKGIARSLPVRATRSTAAPIDSLSNVATPTARHTLSYASPMASSRVSPTISYLPKSCTNMTCVCPPETHRAANGYFKSGWVRRATRKWPSRWCTGISGSRWARASWLAWCTPALRHKARPGPVVTASAVTSAHVIDAFCSTASVAQGSVVSCSAAAVRGTIPDPSRRKCGIQSPIVRRKW